MTNETEDKNYNRKVRLFDLYNDFNTKSNQGGYWWAFIQQFFYPAGLLATASVYQVILWKLNWNIPFWVLIAVILIKNWLFMLRNYIVGEIAKRSGVWKYSNEYSTKKAHLSPYTVAHIKTIEWQNKTLEKLSGEKCPDYFKYMKDDESN